MSNIEIVEMRYYTTKEVAERLGLKRYQFMYRLDTGLLPDCELRLGGRRFFSEEEVENIESMIWGGKKHENQ
jgi:DNA-binding transcriptional MerR regulator